MQPGPADGGGLLLTNGDEGWNTDGERHVDAVRRFRRRRPLRSGSASAPSCSRRPRRSRRPTSSPRRTRITTCAMPRRGDAGDGAGAMASRRRGHRRDHRRHRRRPHAGRRRGRARRWPGTTVSASTVQPARRRRARRRRLGRVDDVGGVDHHRDAGASLRPSTARTHGTTAARGVRRRQNLRLTAQVGTLVSSKREELREAAGVLRAAEPVEAAHDACVADDVVGAGETLQRRSRCASQSPTGARRTTTRRRTTATARRSRRGSSDQPQSPTSRRRRTAWRSPRRTSRR